MTVTQPTPSAQNIHISTFPPENRIVCSLEPVQPPMNDTNLIGRSDVARMHLSQDIYKGIVGGELRLGAYRDEKRSADRLPIRLRGAWALLHKGGALGPRIDCIVRDFSRC